MQRLATRRGTGEVEKAAVDGMINPPVTAVIAGDEVRGIIDDGPGVDIKIGAGFWVPGVTALVTLPVIDRFPDCRITVAFPGQKNALAIIVV